MNYEVIKKYIVSRKIVRLMKYSSSDKLGGGICVRNNYAPE